MPQQSGMEYRVIRERNLPAQMRDGTTLRADVFRPDAPGRFPVLVTRGPYGKDTYAQNPEHSVYFFSRHGYVVVSQDCRARFDSDGDDYYPPWQDIEDGYDTVEWAARLPWSNGRVGTTGQSYLGATQYMLALNDPLPLHVQVMAPVSASADYHASWAYHTGGAMEWGWMVPYAIHKGLEHLLPQMDEYVQPGDNFAQPLRPEWYRHLPIKDWGERLKDAASYFADSLRYVDDSPYWWRISVPRHVEHVGVAMYHVSSWYDIFLEGALSSFTAIRARGGSPQARRGQKLLIGPWAHLRPYTVPTSREPREADFGPEALIRLLDYLLRWFDYWLKDIDTGVTDEPPVHLFVMGENRWRAEQDWPLARAHYTRYYLHSGGSANSLRGDGTLSTAPPGQEPSDTYVYDPEEPVPTLGGSTLIIPHGVYDQRPVEERQDVLVYTSDPPERDVEITGPVTVKLVASSTARDTDFTAKLVDVHPDGYVRNLQDGVIRARYRESASDPTLIRPGHVYDYDLWATSNVFLSGHRIRVEISSSNFPRFDRNPNTGSGFGEDSRLEKAQQQVCHSADHPSYIVLPVIPR